MRTEGATYTGCHTILAQICELSKEDGVAIPENHNHFVCACVCAYVSACAFACACACASVVKHSLVHYKYIGILNIAIISKRY